MTLTEVREHRTSKTPHLTARELERALGEQDWKIVDTKDGFKLFSPDRSKRAIVYHRSVLKGYGNDYQAFIGKLRHAGFVVPDKEAPRERKAPRGAMLAEEPLRIGATVDEDSLTYRMVTVADLAVDPTYQRMLRPEHARKIAREFNVLALGCLTISERDDGRLIVVDGQHRLNALKLLGRDERKVPCLIATGLTKSEEAGLFVTLNTFKALMAYDLFVARLASGDPIAIAVKATVEKHGLQIGRTGGLRRLPGVNTLWKAQEAGQLDRILSILDAAWGFDDPLTLAAATQNALLRILSEYRWKMLLDDKHLIKVLAKWSPGELVRKASARIESSTASRPSRTLALIELIYEGYNAGIPKHAKLPPLGRVGSA